MKRLASSVRRRRETGKSSRRARRRSKVRSEGSIGSGRNPRRGVIAARRRGDGVGRCGPRRPVSSSVCATPRGADSRGRGPAQAALTPGVVPVVTEPGGSFGDPATGDDGRGGAEGGTASGSGVSTRCLGRGGSPGRSSGVRSKISGASCWRRWPTSGGLQEALDRRRHRGHRHRCDCPGRPRCGPRHGRGPGRLACCKTSPRGSCSSGSATRR